MPFDGLSKAMGEAPFWTAAMSALAGAATLLAGRKAGDRVRLWATKRNGNGNGKTVMEALAGIERAIREENDATRKAIYSQAEKHREAIQPIGQGIQRLLGRGDGGGNG